jgi:hypothetical protein
MMMNDGDDDGMMMMNDGDDDAHDNDSDHNFVEL